MKAVLVLNAGSSSLKFALYPLEASNSGRVAAAPAVSGQVEGIGARPEVSFKTATGERIQEPVVTGGSQAEQHRDALEHVFALLARHNPTVDIVAAGHRIVHGGEHYSAPTRLEESVLRTLDAFVPLAPLHQPHNLRAVRAVAGLMPQVPQVGCFDTAFHRTQPAVAQAFALPRKLSAEGIKRYGFHGLSYDYVARQLPEIIGERAKGAVVIAHLGNGASMCALRDGRSVASTMGFTAVEGLMMGTRTGSLDPGVMLYLMEQKGMDANTRNRACSACRASARTCAPCSPPTPPRPRKRWTCSATASRASSARWLRRRAGWTRWCSPAASASTPRRCARRWPRWRRGWASRSTPPPTPTTPAASTPRPAASRSPWCRPTKSA